MNKSLQKLYFHFSKNNMHVYISHIVFKCIYCEREREKEGRREAGGKRKKKILSNR